MSIEGVVELPDIGSGSGSDILLSTVEPPESQLLNRVEASDIPSSTVKPSDTLLNTVEPSEIPLSAVEPLDILLNTEEPTINSTTCLSLYDGWNINGEIYPYYEIRHIRVTWRGIKVMYIL